MNIITKYNKKEIHRHVYEKTNKENKNKKIYKKYKINRMTEIYIYCIYLLFLFTNPYNHTIGERKFEIHPGLCKIAV